jgi:hypothetical protein
MMKFWDHPEIVSGILRTDAVLTNNIPKVESWTETRASDLKMLWLAGKSAS